MRYRYLLGLLLLSVSLTARAQKPAPSPPVDTVYFDQDWAPTELKEDAKFARLVRHGANGLPVGTVRDFYYPSWKKQGEGKLLSEAPDVLTGICTSWHENGKMAFRGTFVQGVAQGDFQQWNRAGAVLKCTLVSKDVFSASSPTVLYARISTQQSSTVYTVPIPAGLDGVYYALDVRDAGAPTISLENTVGVAVMALKAYSGDGQGAINTAIGQLTSRITTAVQQTAPRTPSKCHYLVTADAALAQRYLNSKGQISAPGLIANRPSVAEMVAIPPGCRQFYVCVSNDNYQTTAIAQLSVKGVVRQCK
jgi:hypothetical protein